jgi:hypothetical protein
MIDKIHGLSVMRQAAPLDLRCERLLPTQVRARERSGADVTHGRTASSMQEQRTYPCTIYATALPPKKLEHCPNKCNHL